MKKLQQVLLGFIYFLSIFLFGIVSFSSCKKVLGDKSSSINNPIIKLENNKIDVLYSGGEFSIKYNIENPIEGKTLQVENNDDWVEIIEVTYEKVKFRIDKNYNRSSRNGKIILKYDNVIQKFSINQAGIDTDPMIFKVKCTDNGIVYIPLWGNIDCQIDWGDGTTNNYTQAEGSNSYISHQYNTIQSEIYEVRIYGKVTALYSGEFDYKDRIPMHSVTEIVEWGETGLISLRNAFLESNLLSDICRAGGKSFENLINASGAFDFCQNLKYIPENLFANCTNVQDFSNAFIGCPSLSIIPNGLFKDCPNVTTFRTTFLGCFSLTLIPSGLFDNNKNVIDFNGTFCGCSNLGGESPYTIIDGVKYHLYERYKNPNIFATPSGNNPGEWPCFLGCYGLSDYDQIPEDWKCIITASNSLH